MVGTSPDILPKFHEGTTCSSKRTEADFQAWRDQQEWTERIMPCGREAKSCRPRSPAHL
jgi:hypothetical protein